MCQSASHHHVCQGIRRYPRVPRLPGLPGWCLSQFAALHGGVASQLQDATCSSHTASCTAAHTQCTADLNGTIRKPRWAGGDWYDTTLYTAFLCLPVADDSRLVAHVRHSLPRITVWTGGDHPFLFFVFHYTYKNVGLRLRDAPSMYVSRPGRKSRIDAAAARAAEVPRCTPYLCAGPGSGLAQLCLTCPFREVRPGVLGARRRAHGDKAFPKREFTSGSGPSEDMKPRHTEYMVRLQTVLPQG